MRSLIDAPPDARLQHDPDADFLRRLPSPDGPLTVAAFGHRAIQVAADLADRMLLDLVTREQVAILRSKLDYASNSRPRPRLAAWLPAAVEPTDDGLRVVSESVAGYLTIAGYREMFIQAGFEEAVERAESGASPSQLIEALPDDAPRRVGLVGDRNEVAEGLQAYADAGLDEVAVVPVLAGDPNGEKTLRAVRTLL